MVCMRTIWNRPNPYGINLFWFRASNQTDTAQKPVKPTGFARTALVRITLFGIDIRDQSPHPASPPLDGQPTSSRPGRGCHSKSHGIRTIDKPKANIHPTTGLPPSFNCEAKPLLGVSFPQPRMVRKASFSHPTPQDHTFEPTQPQSIPQGYHPLKYWPFHNDWQLWQRACI